MKRALLVLALVSGCERPPPPPPVESYLTPWPPEVQEVAQAPYYAKFEKVPWAEAEGLLRSERHMWIEHSQSGRIYVKLFRDAGEKNVASQVPRGVDLKAIVDELKAHPEAVAIKHFAYQQLRWSEAVAMLRGEVAGHRVRSVGAMHFQRVFLTTTRDVEFLAIQPEEGALTPLLEGSGVSLTVE